MGYRTTEPYLYKKYDILINLIKKKFEMVKKKTILDYLLVSQCFPVEPLLGDIWTNVYLFYFPHYL